MSGLRERLAEAICVGTHKNTDHAADYVHEADAALATFREWLAENGLVVVPREATEEMLEIIWSGKTSRMRGASDYRELIAAAPDALGEKP